ncbi:hypothetical protein JCM17843_23080 [Kordiimonadales bacterium JCM 17843]|nr:hypothetical protein JCM17843_23080 [Kordiimonadales bacterium JCM 17843]
MNEACGYHLLAGDPTAPFLQTVRGFRPRAPWLGGDLQTLRNRFVRTLPELSSRQQRFTLPLSPPAKGALSAVVNHPDQQHIEKDILVVLVHGLGGCEDSAYMHLCAAGLLAQGYGVVRLNLRGVGPSAAHSTGPYHAGLTQDLRDVLSGLAARFPKRPVVMVGFSLGGHMVLRLAGEAGQQGKPDRLAGVMSVCAPVDLYATQSRIAAPRNRVYHAALVRWMKRDARSWVACGTPLAEKLETLRTVRDFDDALVAPAHGFKGAEDYYRRAPCKMWPHKYVSRRLLCTATMTRGFPCKAIMQHNGRNGRM